MSMTHSAGSQKPPFDLNKGLRRARAATEGFWRRVSEGLQLADLWTQFKSEAQTSYGLYSQDVDWKALEHEKGPRRVLKITQAFFWALLIKLTPARRVLLLISLVFLLMGHLTLRGTQVNVDLELRWVGILGLLLLLAMELADRVTMKRDLQIAREIQSWLVPAKPPVVPGADIAFSTRPANTVAGDYYDAFFRALDDSADAQRLLLVVADVAGKSVPAALLMATFQASLQTLSAAPSSLADLVAGLNGYACAHSLGGLRFTTAFFAELDPATRALSYICAGHNAPVLRRVAGAFERLEAGGLPLGISPETQFDSGSTRLERGDLLVIFTDGLIEAVNEKGEEYGEARMLEMLNTVPGESAAETLRFIMQSADSFVGGTRQHDDITCLILRAV
jgi:serine phosphatase RsbU (regulator of sigma subunit)